MSSSSSSLAQDAIAAAPDAAAVVAAAGLEYKRARSDLRNKRYRNADEQEIAAAEKRLKQAVVAKLSAAKTRKLDSILGVQAKIAEDTTEIRNTTNAMLGLMTGAVMTKSDGMTVAQERQKIQNQKDMLNMRMRQLRAAKPGADAKAILQETEAAQEAQLNAQVAAEDELKTLQTDVETAKTAMKDALKQLQIATNHMNRTMKPLLKEAQGNLTQAKKNLKTAESKQGNALELEQLSKNVENAEAALQKLKEALVTECDAVAATNAALTDAKTNHTNKAFDLELKKQALEKRLSELGLAKKPRGKRGDAASAPASAGAPMVGEDIE